MTQEGDQDRSIKRRLLSATISNYAGRLVSLLTWFVLTPLMLHHLGSTEYGLWVLIGSLVGYGWLLNAGVQKTIVRFVAACRADGDSELASRVVATSVWCDMFLGAVAIALSALFAQFVAALFQIPANEQETTRWLLLIMGIGVGITIPCETGSAVLQGLHRYDIANAVDAVGTLLNAAAIVVVLVAGGGLLAVVAVAIPVSVLSQVINMWLTRRLAPDMRYGLSHFDPSLVLQIVRFSWPLLLGQTASLLQRKSDEIVIGIFLPVSFVTPYSLAHRLSDICRDLTKQFSSPFLPLASELHARQDVARLRRLYITGTRLALAIYLPLACTATVLARPILRVWVGPEYADNVLLVGILSVAGVMLSTEWLATAVLQAMARHRRQGVVALASAIGNVGISAVLVTWLGLPGVALGTLLAAAVEYAIVMPYAVRIIGLRFNDGVRKILLPTFVPAAAMTVVLYWIELNAEPDSLVALIGAASVGVLVFAICYLVLAERSAVRQVIRPRAAALPTRELS